MKRKPVKVFVSGCFDLCHVGHLSFLELAKSLGDHLTVSVAPDKTVRLLKREPVYSEWHRLRLISSLKPVDHAFISDYTDNGWDDCFSYIANYKPDIWLIPEDDRRIKEKQEHADKYGVKLMTYYRPQDGVSTTELILKVRSETYASRSNA